MSNPHSEALDKLDDEIRLGGKAQRAYDEYILPFIVAKRQALFLNFCDAKNSDITTMQEAKRMNSVLDSLENQIMTDIDTGKMAIVQKKNLNPTEE